MKLKLITFNSNHFKRVQEHLPNLLELQQIRIEKFKVYERFWNFSKFFKIKLKWSVLGWSLGKEWFGNYWGVIKGDCEQLKDDLKGLGFDFKRERSKMKMVPKMQHFILLRQLLTHLYDARTSYLLVYHKLIEQIACESLELSTSSIFVRKTLFDPLYACISPIHMHFDLQGHTYLCIQEILTYLNPLTHVIMHNSRIRSNQPSFWFRHF